MKMGLKLQSWFRRRRSREGKTTGMGLTVTEDTPADMLAGSMELLVQLPPDHHTHTQRVTVERSTAMMDLLVQIATAHKLAASSYTLQAIGERGLVLPHQSNTPIGALDALEVKLLPKQGASIPRKTKQSSQPFETTFRLQVHLPRNQLYVSRVSPKTNLGDILDEVCREKNLDKDKYELRHPGNHKETLDLSLSLQDYHLQEVTLYGKQSQNLGSALSSQDIMALQRQEERRRQQAKQSVFGFIFKKSKTNSLSTDSLGERSISPARSDETGRSVSPPVAPTRPQRKRRPAPNPPTSIERIAISTNTNENVDKHESREKLVISHSRNSSDSSGYHEASILSDNPDSAGRMPETLPRRSKPPGKFETRKLAHTSETSKSLCNLTTNVGIGLTHAISNTSLSSEGKSGIRKKRAAPKPPTNRPLSSAISIQALERIVDSEESLTSDMGISKPPSDIAVSSETETHSKSSSDISMNVHATTTLLTKSFCRHEPTETDVKNKSHHATENIPSPPVDEDKKVVTARVAPRAPVPMPRSISRGPTITTRRIPYLSSLSPSDAVTCTHIVEYQSKKIDGTGDFDKEGQENRSRIRRINVDGGGIDAMNERGVIIETRLQDDEEARDTAARHSAINSNGAHNQAEFPYSAAANNSLISNQSCGLMAIPPKRPYSSEEQSETSSISMNVNVQVNQLMIDGDETLLPEMSKNIFQSRVSRSISASSDSEMSTPTYSEEGNIHNGKIISCELDTNSSIRRSHMRDDEVIQTEMKISRDELSGNDSPPVDQYPSSIIHNTNLGLEMDLTYSTIDEILHFQQSGDAGADRSLTVTDRLLQEVSTTLANVSTTSECLLKNVMSNEVNHAEIINQDNPKTKMAPVNVEASLDSAPNSTLQSQQDTSDYVSATGEDLSATDWEYQLPDPPSAFRDSIALDYKDYEALRLSPVDTSKEPIMTSTNQSKNNNDSLLDVQKSQNVAVTILNPTLSVTEATLQFIERESESDSLIALETKRDTTAAEVPSKNRENDSNDNLKKDVICELSNKLASGISNVQNRSQSEIDVRHSVICKSAPEIAPTENTLPNFKITTYSTQRNTHLYEPPRPITASHSTDRSQDRIINTFATLSRNIIARPVEKGSCTQLLQRNSSEVHTRINDGPITRTQSVQHIKSTSEDLQPPVREMVEIPVKEQSSVDNLDKSNVVHRSKSYIVLSHNTKYRSDKNLIPNAVNNRKMLKCTSVTNLNRESTELDENTSRNGVEYSHMHQNGKKEERELQSVQILKSILPQLKTNQQLDRYDSANTMIKHDMDKKNSTSEIEEIDERCSRNKTDSEIGRKRIESDEAHKRWRYTGPPAISLGSWSERPRLNVKIKSDTDYKFGMHSNFSTKNDNISGAKTVVNVDSTSNDVDIVNYKDSCMKNVPKIDAKNDGKISSNDMKGPNMTQVIDNVGIIRKKVKDTSLEQAELEPTSFGFAKLRTVQREANNKPSVVDKVLTTRSHSVEPESKEDDVKIDTRPVNFKELTQTFGQVNLRLTKKNHNQYRHSDYYDGRPGDGDIVDCQIAKTATNNNVGGIHQLSTNRHTSVVGKGTRSLICSKKENDEIKKIHMTTTKVNGSIPIVKGFKSYHPNEVPQTSSCLSSQKNFMTGNSGIKSHIPPPPPSMPVITGVTLKSHNAIAKSVSFHGDSRDQLLESIRNFGRDKLRSIDTAV